MWKWILSALLAIPYAAGCQELSEKKGEVAYASKPEKAVSKLQGKKVVMIIAPKNFRDEELLEPKRLFEQQGAVVTVASSRLGEAQGMLGARVTPHVLLDSVRVEAYDAVIFVGGSGAKEYWEDPKAHAVARAALDTGKLVCAICIAPVTLANAGILKGRRATGWGSGTPLEAKGATYTGAAVEVDDSIITANGPGAAEKFAQAIMEALRGR